MVNVDAHSDKVIAVVKRMSINLLNHIYNHKI
jgi:hypothetical protein